MEENNIKAPVEEREQTAEELNELLQARNAFLRHNSRAHACAYAAFKPSMHTAVNLYMKNTPLPCRGPRALLCASSRGEACSVQVF